MELKELAGKAMMATWQDEIERAVSNVKRTRLDRWMRAEWHRAGARDHWSEGREARWVVWKKRHARGAAWRRSLSAEPAAG